MIEILASAGLVTVQDIGRDGYRRFGVGTSGAMDRIALSVGNLLIGNEEGAAGLEVPVFPFAVRFLEDIAVAITGADCHATLDGAVVPPWWAIRARKGQTLTLRTPTSGTNAYLTFSGGLDVPIVLGSRSTHLRGGFGGLEGRTIEKGDILRALGWGAGANVPTGGFGAEPPQFALPLADTVSAGATAVRVLPAAEYEHFERTAREQFWEADWKITPQSNRAGYRLAGPPLMLAATIEMRSHGLVSGVIQVPAGGQPIIQLADAYTAGGYPKIGTVIEADLWRIGQARLGSMLRFVKTTYGEVVAALDAVRAYLDKVRALAELYRATMD